MDQPPPDLEELLGPEAQGLTELWALRALVRVEQLGLTGWVPDALDPESLAQSEE